MSNMSKFQVVSKIKGPYYLTLRNHLSKKSKLDDKQKDDKKLYDPVTSAITIAEQTVKSMEILGRKLLLEAKLINDAMAKCSKELNQKIATEMESAPIKTNNPVESFLNRSTDIAPHIIQSSQSLTVNTIESLQRIVNEILNESKKIVLSSNQITKSTSNKALAMIDDIYYKSTITHLWKHLHKKPESFEDWEKKLMSIDHKQNKQLSLASSEENQRSLTRSWKKKLQAVLNSIQKWSREEKIVGIPPKTQNFQIFAKLNQAIRTLQEIGKDVEAVEQEINKEKKSVDESTALTPYQLKSSLDPNPVKNVENNFKLRTTIREIIAAIQTLGQDPNYFENFEKNELKQKIEVSNAPIEPPKASKEPLNGLVQPLNTPKTLTQENQATLNKIKVALNNVNDSYLLEMLVKRINDNINVLTTSLKTKNNPANRNEVRVGKDYHSRAAAVEEATNSYLMKEYEPKEDNKFKSLTEQMKIKKHKIRIANVEKATANTRANDLIVKKIINPADFESRIVTAEKDTMRCLLQMRTLSEITQKQFDEAMSSIKNEKKNAYNTRLIAIINILENVMAVKNLKTPNANKETIKLTQMDPLKVEKKLDKQPVFFSTKKVEVTPLKVTTSESEVKPVSNDTSNANSDSLSKIFTDLKEEGFKKLIWLMGFQDVENKDLQRLENLGKIPPVPKVNVQPIEKMLKSRQTTSSLVTKPFHDMKELEKINNLEMYFVERLLSVEQLIIRKIDGIQYRRLLGFDYRHEIKNVDEIIKRNLDNFNNEINAAVQTWSMYLPNYRREKVVAQAEKVKADVKTLQLTICHELGQMKLMDEISAYNLEKTVKEGIKSIQNATFEIIRHALEM